jgi:hypothetical protein
MYAQQAVSVGTNLSLLRNFTKQQNFTTIGQTVEVDLHMTSQWSLYSLVSYHVKGKYDNTLLATKRDPLSSAQDFDFTNISRLGYNQFSIGLKHYLQGAYNSEGLLNLYGTAGLGLLTGRLENRFSQSIDTAVYLIPTQAVEGDHKFRRLTLDIALGAEVDVASSFYIYGEVKTWLKASTNPSPYLYNNKTPEVLLLNVGVRILFE